VVSSEAVRLGEEAARRLARAGQHETGPGLTDAEFTRIEQDYGFEFADDHRAFLTAGLPLNLRGTQERPWHGGWPDWRNGNPADLREQLGWPVAGVLFDIEYNNLWHPSWGRRPARLVHALGTARRRLARVPKMIPVYGHRYLPAGGGTHGHPVLSIHQTDIIIYGTDIAEYITNEFVRSRQFISADWGTPPMVPFWSEFAFG
jgi:hypothetical protein